MKREIHVRRTLATAVAILVLLSAAPIYGRAKSERRQDPYYGKSPLERMVLWVQSRIVPPMPEPDPTTTSGYTATDTTDTVETTDTSGTETNTST